MGTVCPGGPNWLGTICPWGPNFWGQFVHGDRKWGTGSPGIKWVRDQMSRSPTNTLKSGAGEKFYCFPFSKICSGLLSLYFRFDYYICLLQCKKSMLNEIAGPF
jgi:hypothetical protein